MTRLRKYGAEVGIGMVLAALVFLAVVASVSVIPFIYAGY